MLFQNQDIQADYIDKNDLRNYLITQLRERLGFEYEVFISSTIWQNDLNINIDETTMSPESNQALQAFKKDNNLNGDIGVLTKLMNDQYSSEIGLENEFTFHYLIPDLEGVYIVRDRKHD